MPDKTPKKRTKKEAMQSVITAFADEWNDTPQKCKAPLRRILSKACSDKSTRKLVEKSMGKVRIVNKKLGRPFGSCKVSDEALRVQMKEMSSESSTYCEKLQAPVLTLSCPKSRASKSTCLSRSQLCKRLKLRRLGVAPASVQRGKCDACYAWTEGGRKIVSASLQKSFECFLSSVPAYFMHFDDSDPAYLVGEDWDKQDSPEYLRALIDYVEGHRTSFPDQRSHLTEIAELNLQGHEFSLVVELRERLEDVVNWCFHRRLLHTLEVQWKGCWYRPQPGVVYLLWDHMAAL